MKKKKVKRITSEQALSCLFQAAQMAQLNAVDHETVVKSYQILVDVLKKKGKK